MDKGKMSIEGILSGVYGNRSEEREVCTCGTFDKDHDCFKKRVVAQATAQIKAVILERLPERLGTETNRCYNYDYGVGFNDALEQVKRIVNEL